MKSGARKKPDPAGLTESSTATDIPAWVAYLGAIAAGLLAVLPVLHHLGDRFIGFEHTDMKMTYRHWIGLAVRSVHQGEFPLWNPYIYCGQPFMPSTHGTLFYPPNWPFLFALPLPLSINLCILTQIAIFAAGTVYLVCTRGGSNIAALFAGCLASLGSLMVCRIFAGHFTMVCTAAWIPVMFALQSRMLSGNRRFVLPFAITGAVMFMGGHLQYAYYYALLLGGSCIVYALCHVPRGERLRWLMRQAGWHAGAGAIAFALVAIEALPAIDIASRSMRSAAKHVQFLREFAMPPENLVTLICPTFFGRGVEYWGRWEWWEACCYFGVSGIALCLATMFVQLRTLSINYLTVMFAGCLLLAIGGFLPGIPRLLQLIPGWMMFRAHNRPINFALVFGVVLAAEGFDLLRMRNQMCRRATLSVFAAIALLALLLMAACGEDFWRKMLTSKDHLAELFNPNPAKSLETLRAAVSKTRVALLVTLVIAVGGLMLVLLRNRIATLAWQWCVIGIAVAEMAWFAVPVRQFSPSLNTVPPQTARFMASKKAEARSGVVGMMNEGTTHEIPSIEGNDIVVTRHYNTFLCAYLRLKEIVPTMAFNLQGESPLLDAANLVYIAMDRNSPAAQSGQMPHVTDADNIGIYRRPNALPRAYVVGAVRWIADNDAAHHQALMSRVDFQQEVLLAGAAPGDEETTEPFDAIPAEVEYRGLHEARIRAPHSGWLVLADGYYPHWKATINGTEAPVYRANSAFRAVKVRAGDEVVYKYRNPVFAAGAWISGIAVLVVALLPGYRRIRRSNAGVVAGQV